MIGGNNGLGCYSLTILRKICLFKNGTDVIIKWKELAKKIGVFEEKLLIFFFFKYTFSTIFSLIAFYFSINLNFFVLILLLVVNMQ